MAHRDKAQGFGFMYVDISKLLLERKQNKTTENTESPVLTNNVKHANFNKDTAAPVKSDIAALVGDQKTEAIRQVRENLDRLQTLHHRLHSMLDELNRVSESKNKKS